MTNCSGTGNLESFTLVEAADWLVAQWVRNDLTPAEVEWVIDFHRAFSEACTAFAGTFGFDARLISQAWERRRLSLQRESEGR